MIRSLYVKLETPLILGGYDGQFDKPPVLRPPAIRGALRFWTRALGGDDFASLESRLWGNTEVGQGICVLPPPGLPQPQSRALLPHKKREGSRRMAYVEQVLPGVTSPVQIRFRFPRSLVANRDLQGKLQAVVWTWLHLGTLGRRSRRGYGSLIWCRKEGDLLEGFSEHAPKGEFAEPGDLRTFLEKGLTQVRNLIGLPRKGLSRVSSDWFRLLTTDQVFVGTHLAADYDMTEHGMEYIIHGLNEHRRGGSLAESRQMGSGGRARLASPMIWRLFRAKGGGYIPVMTWSPCKGVSQIPVDSKMYEYLNGNLGFDESLAGPNCQTPLGK